MKKKDTPTCTQRYSVTSSYSYFRKRSSIAYCIALPCLESFKSCCVSCISHLVTLTLDRALFYFFFYFIKSITKCCEYTSQYCPNSELFQFVAIFWCKSFQSEWHTFYRISELPIPRIYT